MKKIYLSLFAIIGSASFILAQPTLTPANFAPSVGESQFYNIADTNSVLDNTTGANVTFDYTGLQGYGQTQTQYSIDPSTTTFASTFPNATIADTTAGYEINKNYNRLNGTDSITKVGIVADVPGYGTVVGEYNFDPEITMKFPFVYGDIYFDNYAGEFEMVSNGVTTEGEGNVTVSADAWGTLLLPMGVSIDSVIRVKTIEYLETDTIIIGFPPFGTTILPIVISAENINYYKPSISKYPLVSFVSGSYTQDNAVIDSSRGIITQYPIGLITSVNDIVLFDKVSLYPNPSNKQTTTLTFNLKENTTSNISIFNNLGQKVMSVFNGSLNQGVNKLSIKTDGFSKGIYFVKLIIGENTITKKLIIE